MNIFYFSQNKILQPGWFFNREYLNNMEIMDAYKKLIHKVITYLAPLSTNLTQEIDAMFAIELQFSNVFVYLFI